MYALIPGVFIFCTVVVEHGIVNTLRGQLCMEFTVIAVLILTLEIVDTIGYVGSLLDLSNKTACTNSMDTTCRDKEDIAFADFVTSQCVGNRVVLHHLLILFGSDLLFQAVIELGTGCRFQSIPHLCLATTLTLTMGNLVCRMHLDGEILTGIDELDQQRELIAEALVVLLTYQEFLLFSDKLVQAHTLKGAVGHNRLIVLHT